MVRVGRKRKTFRQLSLPFKILIDPASNLLANCDGQDHYGCVWIAALCRKAVMNSKQAWQAMVTPNSLQLSVWMAWHVLSRGCGHLRGRSLCDFYLKALQYLTNFSSRAMKDALSFSVVREYRAPVLVFPIFLASQKWWLIN